jgi:hypothetical protein
MRADCYAIQEGKTMGDQENTVPAQGDTLVEAARTLGKAAGKLASALSQKAESAAPPRANLYQAEYLGSGTFVIHKPKRKKRKMRQSQLKNPGRGSRK